MITLTGDDYNALVSIDDAIAAVEESFRQYARGGLHAGMLSTHVERGAFHVKASTYGRYFAAKLNANFPANAPLPTIQGLLVLFDATNGGPLALMDSMEVTKQRTAAASAVAAKHLARPDSRTLMIYGCGQQAEAHLAALRRVLQFERVHVTDLDPARAAAFAARHSVEVGVVAADVVVTCTTSRKPFLRDLGRGTFVAAVGADNPEKSEVDPAAMRDAVVIADVLEQCATLGDLRAAIAAGTMTRDDVRAELGAIIDGQAEGRRGDDEIIIFDSTGAGFQDAAVAVLAYERAAARTGGASRASAPRTAVAARAAHRFLGVPRVPRSSSE